MSRTRATPARKHLTDEDFAQLLDFRDSLRRFLHWSEEQAVSAGITPAQHQLLLAVRGHGAAPSVSDLAAHLLLRHHSTVELVDRAMTAGLVQRVTDDDDHRVVRVGLTKEGDHRLSALAGAHLEELARIGSRFSALSE
ncbi:MAG: MarR family transcriptional regulator [Actinomycetota bacterium]|nr:MarR family transcriptional regulator [Actinomycetota bacterium]